MSQTDKSNRKKYPYTCIHCREPCQSKSKVCFACQTRIADEKYGGLQRTCQRCQQTKPAACFTKTTPYRLHGNQYCNRKQICIVCEHNSIKSHNYVRYDTPQEYWGNQLIMKAWQ